MRRGWWWPPEIAPPEALVTTDGVQAPTLAASTERVVGHLRSVQEGLAARSSSDIARSLGSVGARFLGELSAEAVGAVSSEAGLSRAMSKRVVEGMAEGWTREALETVLAAEFPLEGVLDGFVDDGGRRVRAFGRGLTLHIGAGSVPGVAVTSLIRALLVKCPSFVKPGHGDIALTIAFLDALHVEDPALSRAAAALYWPGGGLEAADAERRLLGRVDQVVVYGGDAAAARVRAEAPVATNVVLHAHRVGVVVAGRGANGHEIAEAVCLFDQRGCVSPQIVLYRGDAEEAVLWAEDVGEALSCMEEALPPGKHGLSGLSAVHQLRGVLELREAAGEAIRVRFRTGETWTTVTGRLDRVESVGMRTVWIVPCPTMDSVREALDALAPVLQTVGLAGDVDPEAVARAAGGAGASRIVSVADVPFPRADWLHDGQGPLRELVRWAEWR